MTPEFGAASQLEKIDMLHFDDVVAINKFERRGAEDACRAVAQQLVRNRQAFGIPWEQMPAFGTSATGGQPRGQLGAGQDEREVERGDRRHHASGSREV
jgi:methylmalonyl-CoA mutase